VSATVLAPSGGAEAEPRRPSQMRRRVALIEHGSASLFTLVVAWPFLRAHTFVTGFDTVAYSGPNLRVAMRAWRHLRLPLWNNLIFGGVTNIGNPAAGALYPLKALALPFGVSRGLEVLIVAHLLILANGMVALLSWRLRLRAPAATVGTVALLGSGLVMIKVLQFEQLLVLAWVPLLLALIHWVITAARPIWPAIATAVVTTLLLIAGHPQTVYTVAPLVIAFAIAIAADNKMWPRLGYVAVAGLVALMLGAPQLLPEMAATRDSALSGPRPLTVVESPVYRLEPRHTVRALLGNPLTDRPDADAGTYEALSFIGAAAATLAVIGVVEGARRRRLRVLSIVLGAIGLGGLVASFGPATWFYRVAYNHVPLFSQARVPARWITLTVLAAVVLAAIGIDSLRRRRLDRVALLTVAGAVAVVALLGATGTVSTPSRRVAGIWLLGAGAVVLAGVLPRGRRRPLDLAIVALPLVAVVVELGVAVPHAPAGQSTTAATVEDYGGDVVAFLDRLPGRSIALTFDDLENPSYLVAALRPNANALFEIPSLDGYDGGVQVTDRWASALSSLVSAPFDPELTLRAQIADPLDAGLLARFGVRWVVIDTRGDDPASTLAGFRGPLVSDGPLQVFENPDWRGDALAYFSTQEAANADEAAHLIETGGVAPSAAVLTDGSVALSCSGACSPMGFDVARPRPEQATVVAQVDRDAVLRLDEQADRGWSATIDGHHAPTVTVDGLYVGVHVSPGQHVVVFSYSPPGFRAGLGLALLGVVILIAAAVWDLQRRRSVARPTAGPNRLTPSRSPGPE
jgi:hypothetical protein